MPGLVAAFPYPFLAVHYYPALHSFAKSHATLALFLGFLLAIGLGLLAQEFGSRIESEIIDKKLESDDPNHIETWFLYLRTKLPQDLVARGYIHDQVLFLRFELNMPPALFICWIGFAWLYLVGSTISLYGITAITGTAGLAIGYLIHEASVTAKNLARVRKEVLKDFPRPA